MDDLAKYILTLLKDERLREEMGNAAREHTIANFDYNVIAKKMLDIIKEKLELE